MANTNFQLDGVTYANTQAAYDAAIATPPTGDDTHTIVIKQKTTGNWGNLTLDATVGWPDWLLLAKGATVEGGTVYAIGNITGDGAAGYYDEGTESYVAPTEGRDVVIVGETGISVGAVSSKGAAPDNGDMVNSASDGGSVNLTDVSHGAIVTTGGDCSLAAPSIDGASGAVTLLRCVQTAGIVDTIAPATQSTTPSTAGNITAEDCTLLTVKANGSASSNAASTGGATVALTNCTVGAVEAYGGSSQAGDAGGGGTVTITNGVSTTSVDVSGGATSANPVGGNGGTITLIDTDPTGVTLTVAGGSGTSASGGNGTVNVQYSDLTVASSSTKLPSGKQLFLVGSAVQKGAGGTTFTKARSSDILGAGMV
jgi:hypothetical protein